MIRENWRRSKWCLVQFSSWQSELPEFYWVPCKHNYFVILSSWQAEFLRVYWVPDNRITSVLLHSWQTECLRFYWVPDRLINKHFAVSSCWTCFDILHWIGGFAFSNSQVLMDSIFYVDSLSSTGLLPNITICASCYVSYEKQELLTLL